MSLLRINIVMPMAGRGSRFSDVGYTSPKPLIDVFGKPMYAWATDGLPLDHADRLIFICLRDHLEQLGLEQDIRHRYANFHPIIVPLNEVTQGQACTVLKAREWIDNDSPLMIFNADTYCPTSIAKLLDKSPSGIDGALDVFEAPGDKWSFARLDDSDRVLETAEKKRISTWATTGLYYFARGRDFVKHADQMIVENDRVNGEFYVAPLYNRIIRSGGTVLANRVAETWVLGTPEDLNHFLQKYPREAKP